MTGRRVTDWLIEHPAADADPQGFGFSDEEVLEIQRIQDVARLVGLKRYEQPDPCFAQRNLARIREDVQRSEDVSVRRLVMLWAASSPARVALGAACLFVIGLQALSLSGLQPVTPPVHEPVRDFGEVASLQRVSPTNDAPAAVSWPGSLVPASIAYGTGPSQLVEFEF